MTKQSKSFGSTRAAKDHLLRSQGLSGEVRDLRSDVEEGFRNNESRAGFPKLDWLDVTTGALLAAGGDIMVLGRNLLQSQTFDTLTLGLTTAGVVVTCLKPGASGFRMKIVQGTGALAVAFTGGLLTVTLAVGGSTATEVVAKINDPASPCLGIIFAAILGGGGGTVLVAATTALAGGAGLYAGNYVMVSGVEALPKHAASSWTDGSIIVKVPALTGASPARAAGDIVNVVVTSDGVSTDALSGVLA